MVWMCVAIGAFFALFPMASFALIALEVIMVYQIANRYNAVYVGDLVWFCGKMIIVSFVLKFIATWLHFIPLVGQISNSLVAGGFIFLVFQIATSHYRRISRSGD